MPQYYIVARRQALNLLTNLLMIGGASFLPCHHHYCGNEKWQVNQLVYEEAIREINVTVRKSPQKNKFWIHNVMLTRKNENEPDLSTSEGIPQQAYIEAQAHKNIVPDSAVKSKGQEQKKLTEEQQFQRWDQEHNDWAPISYSKMQNVVNDWTNGKGQPLPPKMSAQQVIGWLKGKGVKTEEIRWSGIVPWMEGRKTVTKEELQAVMPENQINIKTKVLGRKVEKPG